MLEIKGLNQFYGESHTLWDVDLTVTRGECTCLMGRNGVGKTTLLQCIMGLLPLTSGSMKLSIQDDVSQARSVELASLSVEQRANLGIGYVPQGRQIFPLLTVQENLEIGLPVRKKRYLDQSQKQASAAEYNKVPEFIFDLFPVLKDMLNRRGGDLSGGQQQQLAIGRALVVNPDLLILDEPTEGIQPNIVAEIGDIIQRLNKDTGLTVLLVEQKLPFARKVADNFQILDRGRAVANGKMQDLSDSLVKEYLTV